MTVSRLLDQEGKARTQITEQETTENLARYYQALQREQEPADITTFGEMGHWQEIAEEMRAAREKGQVELKRYVTNLSKVNNDTYRELVSILSGSKILSKKEPEHTRLPDITVTKPEELYPPLPEGIAIAPGATIGLCKLKDEYEHYSTQISPEGFSEYHSACWWGMASTVAGRRIAIDLARKQYTPLIIMIAARSTLYAKTDTAEVERDVLEAAGLDWLLGLTRTTPQKLLLDMSGPIPENHNELSYEELQSLKQRLAMSGQRGWHYNEFGKLIKSMMRSSGPMSDFVEILLQLSDCPKELPSGTIGRGNEQITRPYLSITGTLTPSSIQSVAGKGSELWSDGFFARMLFSCPPSNAYIDSPFKRGHIPVPGTLSKGIRDWHNRLGEPEIDIVPILDAEKKETGRYKKVWLKELPETLYKLDDPAYEAWCKYRSALKAMLIKFHTTDFDGSYGRLPMMALRVAALAASIDNASQIEYRHWLLGQEQAEKWRGSLHQLYAQVNGDEIIASAEPTPDELLVSYMQEIHQPATARQIMRYGPATLRKFKSREMQELFDFLIKSGVVERSYREGSKAEWYSLV